MGSVSGRSRDFSPWCHAQTGSGTHPSSYPMGTLGSYPRQ